jgi:hypothetical protein
MPKRQYVVCRFWPHANRSYTYHNDGKPLVAGDKARVEDARENGWKVVHVVEVHDVKPSFATKPILEKHVEEPKSDLLSGSAPEMGS